MFAEEKPTPACRRIATAILCSILLIALAANHLFARSKNHVAYGEGLIVNIPLPELEVERVVADIAANGIIRGTKEYNKDEFVGGAQASNSCSAFSDWKQAGKVFYKVRTEALDPRGFQDSNDVGTLAVRYVVQPQGPKNTVLRIDAVFKEDFKHSVHLSDGSVESNEYRDIQDHLDFLELMRKEDVEAIRQRQEQVARKDKNGTAAQAAPEQPQSSSRGAQQAVSHPVAAPAQPAAGSSPQPATSSPATPSVPGAELAPVSQTPQPVETAATTPPPAVTAPPETVISASASPGGLAQPSQTLEQRVKELRKQVQGVVKSPGAPLKSAPFHTALNLQSLAPGTEVLILISTPYWYGVETHEGQHGWIMRDDLEQP